MRQIERFSQTRKTEIYRVRRRQLASLKAVDDAVGTIVEALRATNRLSNTLFIFTSDHGFSWSEHRWVGGRVPYEESIRVPLIARWNGHIDADATDGRRVLNLDLAQTIADAAGVDAQGAEGRSLLAPTGDRDRFVIERLSAAGPPPSYCAVRRPHGIFVHYATGEEELYDLNKDPFEREDVSDKPANRDVVRHLRSNARHLCDPLPPGMAPF